jgi:hypothetical protein
MTACRCWTDTYALGHDGHCCFVHGDRKINNGFREDADICHVPTEGTTA